MLRARRCTSGPGNRTPPLSTHHSAAPSEASEAASEPPSILIFANKMDAKGSLTPSDIVDELDLTRVQDKPWHICASNALTGEGISGGLTLLTGAKGHTCFIT